MRDEDIRELRRAVGNERPLGTIVRRRAQAYAIARCRAGASQTKIADELGVSQITVSRWLRKREPARALVPVEVVAARPEPLAASSLVVTTPRGLRIEGLDFDALCTLLARLG